MKHVDAGSTPVCLAHAEDGNFYALNDVCTHEEFSLSDGELWGMDVECPQHGSRFNLASGKVTGLPAVIRMASLTPAERTGFARDRGSLEPGKRADVVILSRPVRPAHIHRRDRVRQSDMG